MYANPTLLIYPSAPPSPLVTRTTSTFFCVWGGAVILLSASYSEFFTWMNSFTVLPQPHEVRITNILFLSEETEAWQGQVTFPRLKTDSSSWTRAEPWGRSFRAELLTTRQLHPNCERIDECKLSLATSGKWACNFIFWDDKRHFSLSNPTFIMNLTWDHARTDIYHGSFK